MIKGFIVAVVSGCWRRWLAVCLAGLVVTIGCGWWAAGHLGLDTDQNKLLSDQLPYRIAENAYSKAFPQSGDELAVVIDAASMPQAEEAADRLALALDPHMDVIEFARRPAGTDFFKRNGLLFLPVGEVQDLSDQLVQAQPMLGTLARDPSLRGVLGVVDLMLMGLEHGDAKAADIAPVLGRIADVAAGVAAGRTRPMAWTDLMGSALSKGAPRAFVMVRPKLDFSELMPGEPATKVVRAVAADLGLTPANGVRVRLTGSVALTDANFATVAEGMKISTPLSLVAVILILLVAVRSVRLVLIILVTLITGLAATAAFAAVTVGTLNPISVAFAVMFVGIAVDFAIQFVTRYRDVSAHTPDPAQAMTACGRAVTAPLALAAAASAAGFLSFVPTRYVGVSQLGLIAGGGMFIALIVDLTLLPALLRLARPSAERDVVGMPLARPIDAFLARHPKPVVGVAVAVGLLGLALIPWLRFDLDPLNLQDPRAEAVMTLNDLMKDRDTSPYTIQLLAADRAAAEDLAARLDQMPEIDRTATLNRFVPEKQDDKLAILADLASLYQPLLAPGAAVAPPSADETMRAMARTADKLDHDADDPTGQAHRLAALLTTLRAAGPERVGELDHALVNGLPAIFDLLRGLLNAKPVTEADLPADLTADWRTADGRYKINVWPKEDMSDQAALRRFVRAVQSVAPSASGMPVSVVEAGEAVVASFVQAGLLALAAVAVLLGFMLRRVKDALLVVAPLVLGGLYTVIGCVALGLAINFANIIALPLLLGIGVAFNIYFVVNWRAGVRDHLETPTGRAVLFSALTTSSAFGSLALSPHVGTASMGLLLFLSVTLSVTTTFLVLPALFHLIGKPE